MQDDFNNSSWSHFWLIFWAIAILNDADRHEKKKRKQQQREKRIEEEERRRKRRRAPTFRP